MKSPVINGRSVTYPVNYGAHYAGGSEMVFFTDADFASPGVAELSIPNLPITVLSAAPITVREEFFGMSVKSRQNDRLPGITATTVRSHDLANAKGQWRRIETSAGVFDWSEIDSWVDTHYAAGREMLFTLFGTPRFYSARSSEIGIYGPNNLGLQAEPFDLTKWDAFCAAVAARYRGKIRYFEIWNEPNMSNNGTATSGTGFFFSGTFAKLSEMARRASQAIKAIDPMAKIISPAITNWSGTPGQSAENYFLGMMDAPDGAAGKMKDWIDIVGVHLYLPSNNDTSKLASIIDRINAAKTTALVAELPIWDTESAPIGGDVIGLTDEQAMRVIGRSMIIMAAKGIARTAYYQYDHGTMGIISRPEILAYRERLISLLKNGNILNAYAFADGRIAYSSNTGLTII
jgi:hypothetical protein